MGLDIHIDVANRKTRDEAIAKNQEIRERNDKAYQEKGDKAEFEPTIDIPSTQEYYFRKFNALVDWVGKNVGALDNCQYLELNKENIKSLQTTLNNLTPQNCAKEFPTRSGFFFGSQDYDEWYWEDIRNAKKMCNNILAQTDWNKEVVTILIWY